ncbi:hypothetical protein ACFQV8_16475 [Pseudonocardia benzenivorans]
MLAALAFVATWLVLRSRLGLQLRAIQADQEAAQASGVLAFRVKLVGLAISAVPRRWPARSTCSTSPSSTPTAPSARPSRRRSR